MKTSIGQNIKALRLREGLTQEQLAGKLFVTRQTVSLWELGRARPDVDTLQKVADLFGVDLMTVLYGETSPQSAALQWRRKLIEWGSVTAILATVGGAGLKLMDGVRVETFSMILNRIYIWLRIWGVPLVALCLGVWLGHILKTVFPKRKNFLWWLAGVLCFVPIVCYVSWWLWSVPRAFNVVYVYMARMPWIFLVLGCGINVSARGGGR